jgi:membrane-bound lytic murein transglycosylase D
MEFRSAFPVAVLLGAVLGAATVSGSDRPGQTGPAAAAPGLVSAAIAGESRATWDIPVERNAAVDRFVDIFTGRQSDRMALYLKRSGRYEGMIRGKLRERGMPEDLLYLSMIESGFNPNARSHAQAVGLWQFIADTGRRYGLRVDGYVDERRDPVKSTDAALRYLQDLHGQFGSWYLAAAAYNTGEGRVARVMRSVRGRERGVEADFWKIRRHLPRETREYVPLMVAAAVVAKEPGRYGLGNVERWSPLETETVPVPAATRLRTVAEAVGVSERELRKLNPHLLRSMTPPGRKPYPVHIPEGRAGRFSTEFPAILAAAQVREKAEAAERARVAAAKRAEDQRRVATRRAEQRRMAARATRSARTHTVRRGESLWTIARRNNTTVRAIQSANGLGRRTAVKPGQKIRVPRAAARRR